MDKKNNIETLVSTMMGVFSIKEIEDQKRESAEHSINAKISLRNTK